MPRSVVPYACRCQAPNWGAAPDPGVGHAWQDYRLDVVPRGVLIWPCRLGGVRTVAHTGSREPRRPRASGASALWRPICQVCPHSPRRVVPPAGGVSSHAPPLKAAPRAGFPLRDSLMPGGRAAKSSCSSTPTGVYGRDLARFPIRRGATMQVAASAGVSARGPPASWFTNQTVTVCNRVFGGSPIVVIRCQKEGLK